MRKLIPVLTILLLFVACGTQKQVSEKQGKKQQDTVKKWTYNRILKTNNYTIKYEKALEYYSKEKYTKALSIFEQLVPHEKGLKNGAEIYFLYAMCNYKTGNYLYAGYHFKTFYETYPNSQYAEEALFMSAYCNYLESPRWSLDQAPTNDAINQFQLFLSKFPKSKLIDSSNVLIDTLRFKLAEKTFKNAKLYYDLEVYKAAQIALNNAMIKFPGSSFNEESQYLVAKSSYKYAAGSIKHKQKERYENAISECLKYKENYPNGHYLKDIEKFMVNSENNLKQFSKK